MTPNLHTVKANDIFTQRKQLGISEYLGYLKLVESKPQFDPPRKYQGKKPVKVKRRFELLFFSISYF